MKISEYPQVPPLLPCKQFGELVKPQGKHFEKKDTEEKIKKQLVLFFEKILIKKRPKDFSKKKVCLFFSLSPSACFFPS